MKIWKKHMEISFILVLVFVLIGCSSEQKSTNTTKTENPQPDTEMNESLKAKLVPVHTDEFTFYVMPEWTKRNNEYIYDVASGSRVIIMTEANSSVKSKVLKLLPKLKTRKMNGWCAV